MTRQISLKIETYQLEELIEERTLSHHTINILSNEEVGGWLTDQWWEGKRGWEEKQRKHP